MIPLKDNIPAQRVSVVNTTLIILNVVAFLFELTKSPQLDLFFAQYGLIPVRYSDRTIAAHFSVLDQAVPFATYMFLHGGWLHLLGNMWTLWIFGDNVEDRLGHGRYLAFYLLSGGAAALIHLLTNFYSKIPTVGASGAVAGVMGAYFILYPRARVLTLIPLIVLFPIVEVPAFFFLGIWFLMQLQSGLFGIISRTQGYGGIAWWAHVGGFLAGVLLLRLMLGHRFGRR